MSRWARFFYRVLGWIAPEIERGWAARWREERDRADAAERMLADAQGELTEMRDALSREREAREAAQEARARAESKIAVERENKLNAQHAFDRKKRQKARNR